MMVLGGMIFATLFLIYLELCDIKEILKRKEK